jgi:hypothetical protein
LYVSSTAYISNILTTNETVAGVLTLSSGSNATPPLQIGGFGIYATAFALDIKSAQVNLFNGASLYLTLSTSGVGFGSSTDAGISRLGAASLAIGNGTAGDFSGIIRVGVGSAAAPSYALAATGNAGMYYSSGNGTGISYAGVGGLLVYSAYAMVRRDSLFAWSSDATFAGASPDTGISRLGAASLAIGNGTAGNTTGKLTLTSTVLADFGSAPTSAGTAGTVGQIVQHSGILYFCSVTGAGGGATQWNTITLVPIL